MSNFQTDRVNLCELLKRCDSGELQLPDFQRSWVWDEDRIKSLIASISRSFPIGALMTLDTGGEVDFKPRPIEGARSQALTTKPRALLLDGQQRMTSLYQVTLREQAVKTITGRNREVLRWFYIDMRKAMDLTEDREEAVVGLPEDRILRRNIGRDIVLDLSTDEKEFEARMFPLSKVFDWYQWMGGYQAFHKYDPSECEIFRRFMEEILRRFQDYQVPVIASDVSAPKEAVCTVFEKVNTGGKPLDAFELVTAMYAADGHELRRDWSDRKKRFENVLRLADSAKGVLANVSSTDFLEVVSLFYTRERRRELEASGRTGRDLPPVTGTREALLNLPLTAYKKYEAQVESGFEAAAKFLHRLHIYRPFNLPYQSQLIPLAAILAERNDALEDHAVWEKLVRWYWNGVFGELYGSAVESRSARDFLEVTAWLDGGAEPTTIRETVFRSDRLKTMRLRVSAAYKGVNALLMSQGAKDFRSGQEYSYAVFFDQAVDIHHIFPKKWCEGQHIKPKEYDSIVNKTPLSSKTNRKIGGSAPSEYLLRLEQSGKGAATDAAEKLDASLQTHLIDPALLRSDNFHAFMADRQRALLSLIERAIGKEAYAGPVAEEGTDQPYGEDEEDESLPSPPAPLGAGSASMREERSPDRAPDHAPAIILELGAEGGRIVLRTRRDASFLVSTSEAVFDDVEGCYPEANRTARDADSFASAIELLDRYPWTRLELLHCTLPTATPYFRRSFGEEVPRHKSVGNGSSGKRAEQLCAPERFRSCRFRRPKHKPSIVETGMSRPRERPLRERFSCCAAWSPITRYSRKVPWDSAAPTPGYVCVPFWTNCVSPSSLAGTRASILPMDHLLRFSLSGSARHRCAVSYSATQGWRFRCFAWAR